MVHHDYEGALLGVKQVSDGIVGNGDNLKKLVPFLTVIMTSPLSIENLCYRNV